MQHLVILAPEPWGLPLSERLMPEYLKAAGYATHAIGKWHLGFHRKEYTPTHRGFDSHYGYWNGYQDYYDHTMRATVSVPNPLLYPLQASGIHPGVHEPPRCNFS
jgi:arylsulfatase A-like enzyme